MNLKLIFLILKPTKYKLKFFEIKIGFHLVNSEFVCFLNRELFYFVPKRKIKDFSICINMHEIWKVLKLFKNSANTNCHSFIKRQNFM